MDPINYSVDVAGPLQSAMQGYQFGAGIRDDQQKQVMQQQQMQAQLQQRQMLAQLANNPNATGADYARVMTINPALAEPLTKAWGALNAEQQATHLSELSQWGAAIKNGQPQVAHDMMVSKADAMDRQSGGASEKSQALRAAAGVVQAHPQFALGTMIIPQLAAHPDGGKVAGALAVLGKEGRDAALAPAALKTADAEAAIKGAEASTAVDKNVLGNQKTAADTAKTYEDIKTASLNRSLTSLDRQIAMADSETKRGELTVKREQIAVELAKTQQSQGQVAQDSQNLATNALETVQQIKDHPGLTGWNRPGQWSGAMIKKLPTTERYALETYVDQLKGQMGYSTLLSAKASSPTGASGFGALSEGELKLISSIAGNLDTDSPDFPKQLAKVESFLKKTQATAVARPALPSKGEAYVTTVPGFGVVDEGRINRIMRDHPGQTREQVLQFLQQVGK